MRCSSASGVNFLRDVEYSVSAQRDLELISQHLFEAYCAFGEPGPDAFAHMEARIGKLRLSIRRLVETPFIGTLRSDLLPGLRYLRRDGAAIWFVPDEERGVIYILAIFFGGQDHTTRMLARLLDDLS
jgi:plasmid stabilization system protein ParE